MSSKMNCELMHPLMFVRDLDAPIKRRPGRLRGSSRGGVHRRGCSGTPGPSNPTPVPPSRGRGKVHGRCLSSNSSKSLCLSTSTIHSNLETPWNPTCSMVTRSQKLKLVSEDLALSESDSESEDNDAPRRRTRSLPSKFPSDDQGREKNSDGGSAPGAATLMNDLYISSDDSSSSSSSTSEITGPSDSESEDSCAPIKKASEPLTGTLKGNAYFCIHETPDPRVYEEFKATSFAEEPLTVFSRFKTLCRDYPLDRAALMFVDKLKSFPIKKIISLLRSFQPLFKEHFLSPDLKSEIIFGSIVLTLVYHWYDKRLHPVNIKLLKLLESYHIDPLLLQRFCKTDNNQCRNLSISNETEITVVCCETYFATDDMKHCVKFIQRTLGNIIEENKRSDLDHVMPLVKRVFSKLLDRRETRPLMLLFSHILDAQGNLEEPIDLTLYYDGVLAVHVAKEDDNCHKRALDLFEKVNYWGYAEASGIAYRGLLISAALLNVSPDRITNVFRMCVNTRTYPEHDSSKWAISVYSSMSKIEMQIYLVQCLTGYLKNIWSGCLKMCRTFLTFHVVLVSNVTRDYVHTAHPKLVQVDHSLPEAIRRLKAVIYYYMKTPVDSFLQPSGNYKLVMFHDVVQELFKKVLKVETVERDQEHCVLCR